MRHLLPALIAALLMGALIALDVARPLGAHPWWSQKTLLIGAPLGLILATLTSLKLRPIPLTITFAITIALAFATAKHGQAQFAASYAEDQLAGKLWYFGWIATGATLAATLTATLTALIQTLCPNKPR
ncbi:hypothetical protein [Shimia sagamensis]|uniref:Uncharacterized protein n=1 Tax=Shimia sagamensis TaxID=1566352 RepID=A0ABY1P866_9RHOB|nr:hypothetical protein [Shimia sagamensis]SMP28603.1 hypothetical protein SAMN06265373_10666 [Shimia sagamensis]